MLDEINTIIEALIDVIETKSNEYVLEIKKKDIIIEKLEKQLKQKDEEMNQFKIIIKTKNDEIAELRRKKQQKSKKLLWWI